jgi:hypothetical protein
VQAQAIAAADMAAADGCTLLSFAEREQITGMANAMRANPLIDAVLSNGQAEVTLAYQDAETGVWVRARPDWLLNDKRYGINVKTAADASHHGFQADVTKYRYFMSAALELDAIEAVFGTRPGNYLHPVIEKPAKSWRPGDYLPVALWELPAEDIEYGRALNRRALRIFADCLSADRWPGYADEPAMCGVSGWARKEIDNLILEEAA